jgi:hypothetical protein
MITMVRRTSFYVLRPLVVFVSQSAGPSSHYSGVATSNLKIFDGAVIPQAKWAQLGAL